MITKRDQDAFNFLEKFRYGTTSHIGKVLFCGKSKRYCQIRLEYLCKQGFIKRTKSTISNEYAYYIDKKSILPQIHHDLIRTELFVSMNESYEIVTWGNEVTIGNIRPDAIATVKDHGITFPVFVEIHLNNQFNFDKYEELLRTTDLKAIFGIMPRVLICTDRQVTVPAMGIKFKVINFNDMKGLDSLFK